MGSVDIRHILRNLSLCIPYELFIQKVDELIKCEVDFRQRVVTRQHNFLSPSNYESILVKCKFIKTMPCKKHPGKWTHYFKNAFFKKIVF